MASRLRWFGVAAAVLVAAGLVLAALAHRAPVRTRVLAWVTGEARSRFGVTLEADRLSYNLLDLSFTLEKVRLGTSARMPRFLEADEVTVKLPWSVVRGGFAIESIRLVRPSITLVLGADGSLNLPRPRAGGGGLERLPIGRLSILGGSVRYQDAGHDLDITASDFDVDLQPASGSTIAGPIAGRGGLRFAWSPIDVKATRFDGRLTFDASALGIETLTLVSRELAIEWKGRLQLFGGSPRMDTSYRATADAGLAARWWPSLGPVSGTVAVTGTIAGPFAQPIVSAEVAGGIAGGTITGSGRFVFAPDEPQRTFAFDYQDLDLTRVLAVARIELPFRAAAQLDGRGQVSWDAAGAWRLAIDNSAGPLHASRGGVRGALALQGRSSLRIHRGAWTLTHAHTLGEAIDVSGVARGRWAEDGIGRSSLAGDATVRARDLAATIRSLDRAGLDLKLLIAAALEGRADASLALSGTVESPRASGTLHLEGFRVASSVPASVQARVDLDGTRLQLDGLELVEGANSLRGRAGVRFANRALEGEFRADATSLGDWLQFVPERWRPAASIDVVGELAGTLAAPRLNLTIDGRRIEIAGQRFDRLSAKARIAGPSLFVDEATLSQETNERGLIRANGRYDFGRDAYEMKLAGSNVNLTPVPAAAEETALPLSGLADVEWEGAGTLERPAGRGQVALRRLTWGRFEIGQARASVALDGDLARVSVTAPELRLTASASAGIAAPHRFTLTGRIADGDLARWVGAVLGPAHVISGAASLTVEASGDLDRLDSAEAEVAVDRFAVAIGKGTLQLAEPARVRYAAGQLAASGVALRSGSATVRASGLLSSRPEDSTLNLAVDGDLQDVEPWLLELTGWSLGARGALHARALVTGTAKRPIIDGDLAIDAGTLTIPRMPPLADVRLRATFRDDALQISEFKGVWQGATIAASGRVPAALFDRWLPKSYLDSLASGDRRARLTATAAPITEQALAPWLPPETLAEIDGEGAATLTVETDALDLNRIRGDLVLDRLALSVARVPFNQEAPTRLRLADGRVTVLDWRWGALNNHIQVGGAVTLGDVPQIDAEVRGTSDLRSISAFVRAVAAGGQADFNVRLRGDARDPDLSGSITVASGELRVRSPRISITGLAGTIDLTGNRITVRETMTGTANGGALRISGELEREKLTLTGGAITANARGVAFEWPRGLRTELVGEVTLRPTAEGLTLGGAVTVRRGAYREPLVLTRQALEALRAAQAGGPEEAGESWLDRVRLDIAVTTAEQVTVDNNYGQFDLGADLRLLGTLASPALAGRLTMHEGGKLFLGGNVFRVDRGTIDFVDPRSIKPELTFTARTRVASYEIVLSARGAPESLTADLTSENDTKLTRSDLASLLLTGRLAVDSSYATSQQAGAQMLTLLSGDLLGFMGQRVGLDAVRVERGTPGDVFGADLGLLSTETRDPSTRLSLTKRLGPQVDVVLSQNLRENGGLTWIVVYQPGRNFEIRGVTRDDGSRSIEASQQMSFGGAAAAPQSAGPRARPRIGQVRITGATGFPEQELRTQLKLAPGQGLDFYQWQKDREALERFYRARGHLEARISARRDETGAAETGPIVLEYAIEAGPRTELKVDGYDLPGSLRRELEDAWSDSVFDGFLLDDVRAITLGGLARANYLRAEATAEIAVRGEGAQAVKTLHLRITPGSPTVVRAIEFTGNAQIATSRLQALVRQRGLDPAAWLAPAELESAVTALYASEGFLAATVAVGAPRFEGVSAFLPVSISEGPSFALGDVTIEGAKARAESDVRSAFGVQGGTPYQSARVETGRQAVEAAYRREGYNHAQARVVRTVDRARQIVDVRLIMTEGPRQILAGVDLTGVSATREGVVDRALKAEVGAPVNLEDWSRARTRLYETGVFRSADIRFEPVSAAAPGPEGTEPVRAAVALEEVQPYRFRYGVQLGDRQDSTLEERVTTYGVLADLQRRNMFGRALTAGLAGRYEKDQWAGRAYLAAPRFFILPYRSSLYLTRSHQFVPVSASFSFVEDRWIATAEQEARWREALRLTWGYGYERTHVFEPDADPDDPFALDITLNIARLTSALTADTRDDPFAPRRGWFSGATLEYSAPALGSDLRFLKTLLQGYYFHAAGPAVLASAARLGTIAGSNAVVSELFLAGGGTTVRGYAENSLGPRDFFGDPTGGRAMIILNQEVRFPIVWWFQGVGFVDAGNVFENPGDLSLSSLKVGVGGGLRLNTPYALFRLDLGVPVRRRPGEPGARWYFSLGHIF